MNANYSIYITRDQLIRLLDSTFNVIMNKEGYYLLRHVEPISKIDSKSITEDWYKYGELLYKLDLKTYLTYRDEIINDLEKNKQLFQKAKEDEGEER